MSPIREAFGLDGLEENDLDKGIQEVKDRLYRQWAFIELNRSQFQPHGEQCPQPTD